MSFAGVIKLIFWLLLIPFCTGLLPYRFLPLHKRDKATVLVAGYLIQFALFELVAIPCMLAIVYGAFLVCVRIYTVVALLAALTGLFLGGREFLRREKKERFLRDVRTKDRTELVLWLLFFAVVCFQLSMAATHMFFDGDDAYYVTESLLAQQAGVMNTILPYTGMSTTLDIRHALSVITMWEAFIAARSGIHATIVAHTVMPFVFLLLTYLVYFLIARLLFTNRAQLVNTVNTTRSKKEPPFKLLRPAFLIFLSVFVMFGNVSIYTPETFLMMRSWQGKSLIANFVLPLVFWILLWIGMNLWKGEGEGIERNMPWVFLALVFMTGSICSSMGVVLAAGMCGIGIIGLSIAAKKPVLLWKTAVSMTPVLIYVVLYLSL